MKFSPRRPFINLINLSDNISSKKKSVELHRLLSFDVCIDHNRHDNMPLIKFIDGVFFSSISELVYLNRLNFVCARFNGWEWLIFTSVFNQIRRTHFTRLILCMKIVIDKRQPQPHIQSIHRIDQFGNGQMASKRSIDQCHEFIHTAAITKKHRICAHKNTVTKWRAIRAKGSIQTISYWSVSICGISLIYAFFGKKLCAKWAQKKQLTQNCKTLERECVFKYIVIQAVQDTTY